MRPRMGLAPGRFDHWAARVAWAQQQGEPVFIDEVEREELDGALPPDAPDMPRTGATLLGHPCEVQDEAAWRQRKAVEAA